MVDLAQQRAVLAGSGVAVPPIRVDNHMLARILETSDQWIQERSGIVTRHYVEPGTGSADLGAEAAERALADAGIEASAVDYIVCATMISISVSSARASPTGYRSWMR
jgi:3-oxoacyl-[acyl-carrier-protein] synthase-3